MRQFFIITAAFGALAVATPGQAAPLGASAQGAAIDSELVQTVKKGGRGHFKHRGHYNRGLHRGWRIGRGNPHRYRRY